MKESAIEKALCARIAELGGTIHKIRWVNRKGAPDRVIMYRGKTVWVELKRPGGKPEAHQQRAHQRLRAMGQHVVVVDTLAGVHALAAELHHA